MTGPLERVDVAVVGGGVIGLVVARALVAAGVEHTVVLDKEPAVGQGSTGRANGGVRAQFTAPVNIAFSTYSIGEFEMNEHYVARRLFCRRDSRRWPAVVQRDC